jgi:hypothetical protein
MHFKDVYKDCISKAMIENDSQLLFYKLLFFLFSKEFFSNPNSYFMCASKALLAQLEIILENLFYTENSFLTVLKQC